MYSTEAMDAALVVVLHVPALCSDVLTGLQIVLIHHLCRLASRSDADGVPFMGCVQCGQSISDEEFSEAYC